MLKKMSLLFENFKGPLSSHSIADASFSSHECISLGV